MCTCRYLCVLLSTNTEWRTHTIVLSTRNLIFFRIDSFSRSLVWIIWSLSFINLINICCADWMIFLASVLNFSDTRTRKKKQGPFHTLAFWPFAKWLSCEGDIVHLLHISTKISIYIPNTAPYSSQLPIK